MSWTVLVQSMSTMLNTIINGTKEDGTALPGRDTSGNFQTKELPIACAAADIHAPAAATAAVVTYAAVASVKHCISGVAWSYTEAPTGGNLKVEDVSGTTVFTMDITAAGAGSVTFPKPKKGAAANTAMIVTLASGAGTVVGKVSVLNHWTEA